MDKVLQEGGKGQGFFDFDIAQYYRQNQNDDDEDGIQPGTYSLWY